MDKRAIIGIALSILVLVVYQELVSRFYPSPIIPPAQTVDEAPKDSAQTVQAPAESKSAPPGTAPQSTLTKSAGEQAARDFKVETENYVAVFTSKGARLKSFKFKKYRASAAENSPLFEVVQTAPGVPLPLGVSWQSPQPFDDGELVYAAQGADLQLTGDAKGTLQFQGQTADGLLINKSFTFSGADYPIQLEV